MTNPNVAMPPEGEIVTSIGRTIGLDGRFLISAGHNHFVSDAKVVGGGPGDAVRAGELLLSALASCALSVIQSHAGTLGVSLGLACVSATFKRDVADMTRYEYIRLQFQLDSVAREIGVALVQRFTEVCPIYNTLRRGGNVEVELAPITAA
jgi:uncharacterized OsmC-like protein